MSKYTVTFRHIGGQEITFHKGANTYTAIHAFQTLLIAQNNGETTKVSDVTLHYQTKNCNATYTSLEAWLSRNLDN